jgi:hypothetical protein
MIGRGSSWRESLLSTRPTRQADAMRRALDRMPYAVEAYIRGALLQAFVAGAAAFLMLVILGVPSPLALAVIIMVLDLIPLVGATPGAIIVGVATVFNDFPSDTIIWAVFAIGYQQFENYIVQPRIQRRAVQLDPFLVVVVALFGSALLGILGALLAIPCAAAIQIGCASGSPTGARPLSASRLPVRRELIDDDHVEGDHDERPQRERREDADLEDRLHRGEEDRAPSRPAAHREEPEGGVPPGPRSSRTCRLSTASPRRRRPSRPARATHGGRTQSLPRGR